MGLVISLIGVIALALLFAWLTRRAWRAQRALLKWPGTIAAGLLTVVCVIVGGAGLRGYYKLYVPRGAPAPELQIARSPERLARGERLTHLCAICHSGTGQLPLDGGAENFLDGLGMFYAPNLTPGGPLAGWSDAALVRAIRQGIDDRGRELLIMPAENYQHLSDDDVQSIVAYLRAQPAVDRARPANQLNLLAVVLVGAGVFPTTAQQPISAPVPPLPPGATAEHGRYLVAISGCRLCHGANLTGGDPNGFTPVGPHLPAILANWSADDFVKALRTGIDSGGHQINPTDMPWRELSAAYSDEELRAIYIYVRSLPAR